MWRSGRAAHRQSPDHDGPPRPARPV